MKNLSKNHPVLSKLTISKLIISRILPVFLLASISLSSLQINSMDRPSSSSSRAGIATGVESLTNEALMAAVEANNLAQVKAALTAGANVNYQNDAGVTPLMKATGLNNLEIVKHLLEIGADPKIKAYWNGFTALHFACMRHNLPLIREDYSAIIAILLPYGAK